MNSLLLKRPIAYFIDFMFVWCACVLPQLIAYWLFDGVPFKYFNQPYHVYFWVLLTVSLPIWLYFILQEMSIKQSTIGKRFMHLKVTDNDNLRISKKKSFVRTLIKLLPWEITHIGLIPIYFSEDPQPNIGLYLANGLIAIYLIYFIIQKGKTAVHDIVSRTKVISNT
jgi:uncharacterized RDD family membrane protein YckC